MDGWIVMRHRDCGQNPKAVQCKLVYPASHCGPNKRCLLHRLFRGKNSRTSLTRNAVICKAFPVKQFISCPMRKAPVSFLFNSHSESQALLLCAHQSSLIYRSRHNNRNTPCNKCHLIHAGKILISVVCGVLAADCFTAVCIRIK